VINNLFKMKKLDIKIIIGFIFFIALAITAVVLLLIQGLSPFFVSKNVNLVVNDSGQMVEMGDARLLDGVYMEKGEKEKYPVAVTIDNKLEARPWSGVSYAGIVFEAPVEGGITRFLAIFSGDNNVEKIGPVRSARPYFIDYAMGVGAIYAHVGGSPEALDKIANDTTIKQLDLNQYSNGISFWRSEDRIAPHNVYTSSDRLDKIRNKKIESDELSFDAWRFKDDLDASVRGSIEKVEVNFPSYNNMHNVVWEYDNLNNVFRRTDGEEVIKDALNRMILAKNIAVVETDIWIIDSLSRRKIRTEGTGNAIVFQDGKEIKGTWKKKDSFSQIKFYNEVGEEISFVRGQTWVEIVSNLSAVTVL